MRINKLMLFIVIALAFAAFNVAAANQNETQHNITTNLSIYDVPSIGVVTLDDADAGVADEIDSTPGTTTTITCEAVVTDLDGDTDITSANATFYHTSVGSAAADNDLNHYFDGTCTITPGVADNDADVSCTVDVLFYAEHGAWNCNMSVADGYGLTDSATDPSGATVTDLLAFNVTTTDLDFGQLAIGENTTTTDYTRVITNNGNVNLSMSLNVWGTALNDARSMTCDTGYTEPSDMRVAIAATQTYASRTQLASTNDDGTALAGFSVNHQTVGATGTTGTLYFGMGVSSSGSPTGTCSGNLMFTASEV